MIDRASEASEGLQIMFLCLSDDNFQAAAGIWMKLGTFNNTICKFIVQ